MPQKPPVFVFPIWASCYYDPLARMSVSLALPPPPQKEIINFLLAWWINSKVTSTDNSIISNSTSALVWISSRIIHYPYSFQVLSHFCNGLLGKGGIESTSPRLMDTTFFSHCRLAILKNEMRNEKATWQRLGMKNLFLFHLTHTKLKLRKHNFKMY